MDPISIVGIITAIIPLVTSVSKKLIKTDRLAEKSRKGVNALLPIVIGILSSGIYSFSQGQDWVTALAIGMGSGGAASSGRNIEKNIIRMVESIGKLIKKDN